MNNFHAFVAASMHLLKMLRDAKNRVVENLDRESKSDTPSLLLSRLDEMISNATKNFAILDPEEPKRLQSSAAHMLILMREAIQYFKDEDGADPCACDNTHKTNRRACHICEYKGAENVATSALEAMDKQLPSPNSMPESHRLAIEEFTKAVEDLFMNDADWFPSDVAGYLKVKAILEQTQSAPPVK